MVWVQFTACSALLTFFAYNLCNAGVVLSEKTRISAGVVGIIFLAIATSFPEIITAATSVFYLGKIGLGYGDIVGSVIINLMILVGLDAYIGKGRILLKVSRLNRLTGSFILVLLSVILGGALLRSIGLNMPSFKGVGIESFLIILIYGFSLRIIKNSGQETVKEESDKECDGALLIWLKFIGLLTVVMLLGIWMASIGEKIVETTTLSQSFTGSLLLGFATSLPEIIVSFAALRAGSADMAVGNILGSNLFDVCIIPFLDMLTRAPILGMLSSGDLLSTGIVVMLSAFVVISFLVKRQTSSRINWDTGLIFAVGFAGFVLLYVMK